MNLPPDNTVLAVYESVRELPDSALSLLDQSGDPFLNAAWFAAFEDFLAHALGQPLWLALQRDGATLALLPLLARDDKGVRVLHSMTHFYSPRFTLLADSDDRYALAEQLVALALPQLRRCQRLRLLPLSATDATLFERALAQHGFPSVRYLQTRNWSQAISGSFDDYWAARPSRLRTTLERKQRRLAQREHRFCITGEVIHDQQLADYHRIYHRSWKRNEPYPAFIDALARNASRCGQLRLGLLYIEGVPAAGQLWLVHGRTASIFKLAHDPDFADFSAGSLLSRHLFEHVISEDGVSRIDYLTGDDDYKRDWMGQNAPLYGLECFNTRNLSGRLAYWKHALAARLRGGVYPGQPD